MSSGPPSEESETPSTGDPGLDIDHLRRRRELVLTFLAVGLIVGASLLMAFFMLRPPPVDRAGASAAAQRAVRETLGGDFVFHVKSPAETVITPQDDGHLLVQGGGLRHHSAGIVESLLV